MASIKPLAQADRRPLSGVNRSREPVAGAAVDDPKRRFAAINYRIAKGLFDHLVGTELDPRRQFDADRLGGLEVEDQFEFYGLLNGKIEGFRPVEYF
jgi:hypothetical protein